MPEYAVHQIEIAVSIFASKPMAIKVHKQGRQYVITTRFEGGKQAVMTYSPSLPFTVCADLGDREEYREISSDFFAGLMADIINFFETGGISFDVSQTLSAMKIRGAIISLCDRLDEWVAV